MPDISTVVHSEYADEATYWAKAWDVYRGGRHVVAPDGVRGNVPFWVTESQDGDTSEDRTSTSRQLYQRKAKSSYLSSYVREHESEYDDRVARALHIPLFRSIVDVYVSAVLRTDAERKGTASSAFWPAYWSDMDLAGTQVDTFFRQALTYALVFKKAFAVTDRVGNFAQPAPSRGAQIARGERAYSYLISPDKLRDVSLDQYGRMIYGVVEEDVPMSRTPGKEPGKLARQYRVWYRDRWELHRELEKGKWGAVAGGVHPVGEVPIAPIYARRGHESRRTMAADGILTDVLDADLGVFNLLSLFHDQLYSQAFAQLVQPADGTMGDLELGVKRVLYYDPDSGAPSYIEPNPALISAMWQVVNDHISLARQMASTSRGRAEYSKEERSAAAIQAESGDKSNAVASLVGCVEEFDRTVHRHAAAWEDIPGVPPTANYSRDVSLKALSAQIHDATALAKLGASKKAMAEIYKPLFARILREHGQGEDAIGRAHAAIEAEMAKAVEAQEPNVEAIANGT